MSGGQLEEPWRFISWMIDGTIRETSSASGIRGCASDFTYLVTIESLVGRKTRDTVVLCEQHFVAMNVPMECADVREKNYRITVARAATATGHLVSETAVSVCRVCRHRLPF